MEWQYDFINNFVKFDSFESDIKKNVHVVNTKNQYIPETLIKFYNPTFENLLDIKNKRLWMADPSSFNDPFDCNIGYNYDEFEKYTIIRYILNNGLKNEVADSECFTQKDLDDIYNTYISKSSKKQYSNKSWYWTTMQRILSSKSERFQNEVRTILQDKKKKIDNIIKELKTTSVRISCFSGMQRWNSDVKKNLMWAHYANNHQGFCVEYDISSLRQETKYKYDYQNDIQFTEERREASIKAGLFPIRYNNKRVNIPKTLLDELIEGGDELNSSSKQKIKKVISRAFITKSTAWNYEKEWRIILDEHICKYYNYKIPFPYIKTIFIGCRASNELERTLSELGEELGVDVKRMREDKSNFDLYEGNLEIDYTLKKNPFI